MAAARGRAVDEDDFLQSVDDLFFSDFFPNTDQASSFVTRFNAIMPLAAEDPSAFLSIPPPSYSMNAPLPLMSSSSSAAANSTKNGQSKAAAAMMDMDDSSLPETNKRVKSTRKTPEERAQHRRELNKKNAARSRLRKKFKIESVIVRAAQLEQENALLKSALKQHGIDIPLGVAPPGGRIKDEELEKISKESLPADYAMLNAIQMSAANFILTDATKPDYPIVFASPGFLEMTGYARTEVMGRNCRFLQGEHTDHETVSQIRKSIQDGHDIGVTILNYKKDGTPFWNQLFIAPLADQNNQIKYHVGVQRNLQVVNITGDLEADAPADD